MAHDPRGGDGGNPLLYIYICTSTGTGTGTCMYRICDGADPLLDERAAVLLGEPARAVRLELLELLGGGGQDERRRLPQRRDDEVDEAELQLGDAWCEGVRRCEKVCDDEVDEAELKLGDAEHVVEPREVRRDGQALLALAHRLVRKEACEGGEKV